MHMRTVAIAVVFFILGTISIGVAYAWNGPTAAPPGNNVAAPLNVSTNDQQKPGWVGLDSLSIFKHMIVTGSRGADPTVRYLNFGTVWDASGYGIRDNDGTLEFKNDRTGLAANDYALSQTARPRTYRSR
jgi:hypothetical protein